MLSLANCLLAVASYLPHRHESGIDLFIKLSARKRIIVFPKMSNYSFKLLINKWPLTNGIWLIYKALLNGFVNNNKAISYYWQTFKGWVIKGDLLESGTDIFLRGTSTCTTFIFEQLLHIKLEQQYSINILFKASPGTTQSLSKAQMCLGTWK